LSNTWAFAVHLLEPPFDGDLIAGDGTTKLALSSYS
jgi:hypothetical protein